MLFFPNAGSIRFYLGAQPNLAAAEFDGLIDRFDTGEENFIFRVFSFLAVELLSLGGENFDFILRRLRQHSKLVRGIDLVLLAFVGRYGLPVWEGIVTTTYPARYVQRLMALRQDGNDEMAYMVHYEAARRACQSSGAVPVCTLALTLLDFYLQWTEGLDGGAFPIRHADWMVAYGQEKTPRLNVQVYDLTTCINLACAVLTTGQGKAIRQCNHCQKFFISTDWRSEYCSPRCRGAYNSKMTRKRVKERKLREEQEIE